ncbi:hypothetical protein EMIHUDRAFT_232437 [Emiliania huxleyi CCMP1516]|uniref:Thioredoxin domain-containing protein n=2 Tax=Emiliania huxleyi TaxID=2903 RepID=A0A0D3K4Z1_EMIH1|nr:hypothetical protein EMIHUDRAFT_232437 [Emiliania huxleyi CCMP1516]EOD30826.1 hypothetical protein EMIHUDRAFT_232437 [Emiliania huxleyi CCMP1516]|eukprot:XP_005783255.1 hypothetical protein EMIHUDRAFT_232437 [Emiliania huxleyi CCMP1516]
MNDCRDEAAYRAKLAQAESESRVVCIKFYASWCRACKAMAPKYKRVADDWPEIEFCEVLFDTNKALCKGLGIKVLPYIEISSLMEKLEVHSGCEEIPCTSVADQLDMIERL